jgi:hypothetical protein
VRQVNRDVSRCRIFQQIAFQALAENRHFLDPALLGQGGKFESRAARMTSKGWPPLL